MFKRIISLLNNPTHLLYLCETQPIARHCTNKSLMKIAQLGFILSSLCVCVRERERERERGVEFVFGLRVIVS